MPCEIVERENGLITIRISGMLKEAELDQAEQIAAEEIRSSGKIRLLFLVDDFQGWATADDWGDVSFQAQYDEQIEKIAIVCEERWRQKAEAFAGKGIRAVNIRCFAPSQTPLAKAWIR